MIAAWRNWQRVWLITKRLAVRLGPLLLFSFAFNAQAYVWNTFSYSETSPIDGTVRFVGLAIPSDFNTVRGLLVNYNASSGDTRGEYTRKYFQNWMRLPEHQFAFIGTKGFEQSSGAGGQAQYTTPVMLRALADLAAQSGHREITNAPWAMYAFSAGATRSWEATSTNSDIVIAWNGISGGFGFFIGDPVPLITPASALLVPAYLNASKSDAGTITNSNYQVTSTNVPLGWLGNFSLIQQGTSHSETWNQHAPGMAWLKSVIKYSYPTDQCVLNGKLTLNRMQKSDGWLVTPHFQGVQMADITNYAAYPGDKTVAWWMPDKDMAYVYRSYASWDNKLAITAPLTETEVAPGGNITVTVDDSQFLGWTNLALFNFSTNILSRTSGAASFVITNIGSGMYVVHVIGTHAGTNAISQPVLFYANVTAAPPVTPCPGTTWYAATNGTGCCGTLAQPWDLQTALSTPSVIPGDFILCRGGNYTHTPQGVITNPCCNEGYIFQTRISGTSNALIVVKAFPGERVQVDGGAFGGPIYGYHANARPTMLIGDPNDPSKGNYVRFQNIEFYSSSTEARLAGDDSSFPTDITRSDGFYTYGIGSQLINCVLHDNTAGISSFPGGSGNQGYNQTFYGNITFNNGWQGTPHHHGHGFYCQQFPNLGIKNVTQNTAIGNYDRAAQIYGSGSAYICNFRVSKNCFIGQPGVRGITLMGTRTGIANRMIDDQLFDNFGFGSDLALYEQADSDSYVDARVTGNYFVNAFVQASSWQQLVFTNNTFISPWKSVFLSLATNAGFSTFPWTWDFNTLVLTNANRGLLCRIEGRAPTDYPPFTNTTAYDIHSAFSTTLPATNYFVLQTNLYDTARAQLVAYNWLNNNFIAVDVSATGWGTNANVLVRQSANYFSDTTVSTVTTTNTLVIDMRLASHSVAIPFGDSVATADNTFPLFGNFFLELTTNNPAPPPVTVTLTVTASNPSTVAIQMSPADVNGFSNGNTPFTRTVVSNSVTTLTAPLSSSEGNVFTKWQRNAADYSTSLGVSFTNNANTTMNAVFTAPTPPFAGGSPYAARRRGTRF